MIFCFTCLVIVKMASAERRESPPPANKRAISTDFDSEIAAKVAKNQSEIKPMISEIVANHSGKFSPIF